MATSFDDFMFSLLNSGQQRHPGVGGGMPATVSPLAAAMQPAMAYSAPAQAQTPQMAPQPAAAPQSAPQGNSGGFLTGLGNVVQSLVAPQSRGRNATVNWLQSQGLDEGTATLLAGNKSALQKFLLDRTQGADPMDALKLEKTQLEIENLRNPTTDDIKEYLFAKKQGYSGTLPQFMQEMRKAGATNVDARQMGTVPPGYRAEYDANGQVLQLVPIPGGPAAAEAEAARKAAEAGKTAQDRTANIVVQDIDRTLGIVKDNPNLTTGIGGMALSNVPGTDAFNASKLLNTVKANAGFDKLQAMRDASPTGGALGQVSEREIGFLQSTIGNLEQSQSAEQFTDNLKRVKNAYLDIIYGPGSGPERERLGFEMTPDKAQDLRSGGGLGAPSIGTVEDGYRFKGGDPGDPNSWERAQ